jgi:hypothetical protein
VASWPADRITSKYTVEALISHWKNYGLPAYAQFDNDTRFQGNHSIPDTVGRVTRLCLSLAVAPVFVVPAEQGFQASIEAFNGRWQAKVWSRFHHDSLADLQERSVQYVSAYHNRAAVRLEAAPPRRPFPASWELDLQAPLRGRIVYLRRTTERGDVELMGHRFVADPHWSHRLVRAEIDLDAQKIVFYALRRSDPHNHFVLKEVQHALPERHFME